ncbi:MAG: oligosaccharide flippase family protein [Dorea sp.]|jgi:O-antigen/teichoic acid export membrane protein|nr:oligosaccharide flippase family protein [Dorea sp.]
MKKTKVPAAVAIKSGMWYTVSNFAFRVVTFIITPIFARVLSKEEYGEYNNITSWIAILFIFTSCDLYTSIIRAKLDYEDDLERYGFSMLTMGSIITIGLFILTMIFKSALSNFMQIHENYFFIMYLYLFFVQGYYVYITIERARYRYKVFSILTGVAIVSSCLFSLLLVVLMQDKLDARVYGQYIPYIFIGMVLYILAAKKGKRIYLPYFKYGLMLSLPLVPHLLSMTILSSSDRIMITKMEGAEYTAVYSVACIVANIVSILIDSMNKAWAPWFLDSLKAKDLKSITKISIPYFKVFVGLIIGILLAVPELVLILGGSKYTEGIYAVPPLIVGCVFQFAYTMYVQVEFYEKRMKMVAIATSAAALVNIAFNYFLIPRFGYMAASYTTLIGYMVLFFMHYVTVRGLGYKRIFERRVIFGGLTGVLMILPAILLLYHMCIVRYAIFTVYVLGVLFALYQRRDKIRRFTKMKYKSE